MIYIDYFGGTHGQFLEFLVAKHILCLPQYQNYYPFKSSGVSHLKPIEPFAYVCADHFSYGPITGVRIDENISNLLIQIIIEPQKLQDIFVFNIWQRAGEKPVDFNNLNSVYEKINPTDLPKNITRQVLRNLIYSQIREDWFVYKHNDLINYNISKVQVKFENFYSYEKLLFELEKIAAKIQKELQTNNLRETWKKFIELNSGYQIRLKIDEIFANVVQDNAMNLKLDLYEEASLNARITTQFDIHSDISVFDDRYPQNTILIAQDIKSVMKSRNPKFSMHLPIDKQLDKITRL